MSNALTGEYDAVVEISVATVNRLLATVHQKVALDPEASPKLLHSLVARVGDTPKFPKYEIAEVFLREYFGANALDHARISQDTLAALQEHVRDAQESLREVGRDLSKLDLSPSPSGGFSDAFEQVAKLVPVRGTARIQVGTPTISLSHGSTSELTVHAEIRAHYTPDPNTLPLPKPIHGEVKAAFTVDAGYQSEIAGKPALQVKPTTDDNKIAFVPAPGTSLSAAAAKQIAREVGRFLRTKFEPMIAGLPNEFPFLQFKSLAAGSTEVIALPLMLSEARIPEFALNSIASLFLQSGDDFAVAISRRFVNERLRDFLKGIEKFSISRPINPLSVTIGSLDARASSASVKWQSGKLTLIITGAARIWLPWVSANHNVTIQQDLGLKLDAQGGLVLEPLGHPSIEGLPAGHRDRARSAIEERRKEWLDIAQKRIQELTKQLGTFDSGVNAFTPADVTYTSVEIDTNGIILRGRVSLAVQRPPVVVDFFETAGGTTLSALRSWIPGGTIAKHVWNWFSTDPKKLPWHGILNEMRMPHTFMLPLYPTLGAGRPRRVAQQVWLRIEGEQFGVGPGAGLADVLSDPREQTRKLRGSPLPNMPAWWVRLTIPIWGPVGPDEILSDAMVAHINALSEPALPGETATTPIIHFVSDRSVPPLPILSEAFRGSRLREAEVPVILVLPQGSFHGTRASVESRLGAVSDALRGPLLITEDHQGSWTKAFNAPAMPATYLMNGTGEFAWKHVGPLEAPALTAALDQHGRAGPHYQSRFLRLAVRTGEPAPDAVFRGGEVLDEAVQHQPADHLLLRPLRGQRVRLLFWKSWSAPCLAELRRLQRMHDGSRTHDPVILAIGDGEEADRVKETAREHNLRFRVVPDPKSLLATRFGVACWPTTVSIDEGGRVQQVQFGTARSGSGATPGNQIRRGETRDAPRPEQ